MNIYLILSISKQELKITTAKVQQDQQCIRGRWDKSYDCISRFVILTVHISHSIAQSADSSGPHLLLVVHHTKMGTSAISNNLKYSVTEAIYRYNITTLKLIRKTSRHNYSCNNLPNSTHTWIITPGIRKTPLARPYRRSKARHKLFHWIHSITKQGCPEPNDERVQSNDVSSNNLIQVHITTRSRPSKMRINPSDINASSICKKIPQFQQHILQNKVDLCTITETWLKEENELTVKQVPWNNYNIKSYPRPNRQGGDIAMTFQNHFRIKELDSAEKLSQQWKSKALTLE